MKLERFAFIEEKLCKKIMFLQVFYSIFVGFMFFLPMALKLLTSHHNHRWYNIVLNFKKENKNA